MKYLVTLILSLFLLGCYPQDIEIEDNYFLSFNFKTGENEPSEFYSYNEIDSDNSIINSNTNIDTIINGLDTSYISQTIGVGYYIKDSIYASINLSYKFNGLVSIQDVHNKFSMGEYEATFSGHPLEMFHIGIVQAELGSYLTYNVTDNDIATFEIFEHSSIYSLGNEQCFDIKFIFEINMDAPDIIDRYIFNGIAKIMLCY